MFQLNFKRFLRSSIGTLWKLKYKLSFELQHELVRPLRERRSKVFQVPAAESKNLELRSEEFRTSLERISEDKPELVRGYKNFVLSSF